jgi:ribosomal protein S18 acetylase RimI-like enzyme
MTSALLWSGTGEPFHMLQHKGDGHQDGMWGEFGGPDGPRCARLSDMDSARQKSPVDRHHGNDDLVFRAASSEDASTLAATIATAFEQYRGRLVPESAAFGETPDRIAREFADGSGAIIAEQHEAALGCVMIRPVEDDLYFGRLAVIPSARGRGIGRLLVGAVEAEAARRGLAGVRMSARIALPANQRFFSELGYVETAREAHPGFDHPTTIHRRKSLSPAGVNRSGR